MSNTNDKAEPGDIAQEVEHEAASNNEEEKTYQSFEEDELRDLLKDKDEEMEQLRAALEQAKEGRLRKAAEFENYRKRVQRERSKIYDTAKASALEDFLSISDDLTRTLKASEELEVNQTFLDGVTLVADKFDEVLKKHGVQRIDQEGVPFDVDMHDALMRRKPEDESVGSDTVLSVVENGYKIGDRTIRHAKVIVSE